MKLTDPIEPFLRRVVPGLEACEGASLEEIAEVQERTEHQLPPFYLWFLHTMGRSMGPLTSGIDLSIGTTLQMRDPDNGFLIGFSDSNTEPVFLTYDFSRPNNGDCWC